MEIAVTPPSSPPRDPRNGGRFTGWHMTAILVVFFGIVFAVNFTMANLAVTTFTGEVVDNGYVASQHFNRWLADAEREKALGWSAAVTRLKDGHVAVAVRGAGTTGAQLGGEIWRPIGEGAIHPRPIAFVGNASNVFISREALPAGRWQLRLTLVAGGHKWHAMDGI
jgi:nitrogen fixation protein FixH